MEEKYIVIAFRLDLTFNPCGTPCRSIVVTHVDSDPEEALRVGLIWEELMKHYIGTDFEYNEVQVVDMTGFDFTSRVSAASKRMESEA